MDPTQQTVDAVVKPVTAGVLLKTAREAQGLHIAALAVTLKVPVHKLEALEANRYEALGDSVFTRALAASVCRVLKIDAVPVLAALPHSEIPRFKTDDAGLNTPFKRGGVISGPQLRSRLTSPMGIAVALLLLGVMLVFMLPERDAPDLTPTHATAAGAETAALVAAPVVNSVAPPANAPSAIDLPVSQAPVSAEPVTVTAPEVTPNMAPAILVLQAHGASWVEITDAQGVMQLRKNLGPGDQIRSQGPLPLTVVLGRAGDVEVSVRGQRLDLTGVTKANVARFEVK